MQRLVRTLAVFSFLFAGVLAFCSAAASDLVESRTHVRPFVRPTLWVELKKQLQLVDHPNCGPRQAPEHIPWPREFHAGMRAEGR